MNSAGLPITQIVTAKNGELVVKINNTGVAVCFKSVGGRPAQRPNDFNNEVIDAWAKLLAKMHVHVINTGDKFSNPAQSFEP